MPPGRTRVGQGVNGATAERPTGRMVGMTSIPPASQDPVVAAVRTIVTVPERTAETTALRFGVLRRHAAVLGGVCAALADGWGVPVRLVRVLAVLLGLLGVGVLAYLVLVLVLPAERADGSVGHGMGALGNTLIGLGMAPLLLLSIWWFVLLWLVNAAIPVLLLLVSLGVAAVLAAGARRSREARIAYLMGELARRAGVADETELDALLAVQRRRAPHAWAGRRARPTLAVEESVAAKDSGAVDPSAAAVSLPSFPQPKRPPRPSRSHGRRLGARGTVLAAAVLLGVGALTVAVLALRPGLLPWLAQDLPLAPLGRVAAGAGAIAVVAGLLLVGLGARGFRAVRVATAGILALVVFAGGVTWSRLTVDPHAEPLMVTMQEYTPGQDIEVCPQSGPAQWGAPLVLDLSHLEAPTDPAVAAKIFYAQNDIPEGTPESQLDGEHFASLDLIMRLHCDRPIGDVQVILPADETPFFGMISAPLGEVRGPQPGSVPVLGGKSIGVVVQGTVVTGDITYTKASR